jgi:hypothetical protein
MRHDWFTASAVAAALAAGLTSALPAARAATVVAQTEEAADAGTAEAAVGTIPGFRSANFGANEAEVLAAITQDFGVAEADVKREYNPLEKTHALIIQVTDMIPESGTARIAYILGYKTNGLIQVNVVWGAPVVENPDLQQLATTGNILQRYFIEQRYVADSIFTNRVLADKSVLIFTGSDQDGHQVTLTLGGANPQTGEGEAAAAEAPAADAQRAFLRLSYVASPGSPDVFKIAPGAF